MSGRGRRRRIAVITGSRAEYGILKSTIGAIARHPRLELQLVAAGMHLLARFGKTIVEIERDGFPISARVPMQRGDDSSTDQAEGVARGVAGMARFLDKAKSDVVLVLGDRIEAMAGALAGLTTGTLVAHIHGGDVAQGDFDDSLRHAISKLAHIHFAATPTSAERLRSLGEDPSRIHCVGPPGLDRLIELLQRRRKADARANRALLVLHPCGRTPLREQQVMNLIFRALSESDLSIVALYPNSDRGHSGIIKSIKTHQRKLGERMEVHVSLDRDTYLELLLSSRLLMGNSSSGILEAPCARTPSINIGDRQRGRERLGPSVFDAEETLSSIQHATRKALGWIEPRTNSARNSRKAGDRIAELLTRVPLNSEFRRKVLYL